MVAALSGTSDAACLSPTAMVSRAVLPTGSTWVELGMSISKCTVRVVSSAAGARRLMTASILSPVASISIFTGVPGATTVKSDSGASATMRTWLRSMTVTTGLPGRT